MTQEDKQLLLKDLSARLPYSVWGLHRGEDLPLYVIDNSGAYMVLGYNAWFDLDDVKFKPYLRPMSSMTEEEKKEYHKQVDMDLDRTAEALRKRFETGTFHPENRFTPQYCHIDWLNAHHFDYRGLIDKGLALEAPDNMYKL